MYPFSLWPSGGAVTEWVRALALTDDRRFPAGFESHCGELRFGTLAIPFTRQLCQCISEETLKAVGPFYMVSMPGEVQQSHQSALECVTVVDFTSHSKPPPVRPLWLWRTALYRDLSIITQQEEGL